jgi:hypothetical protein
MTRLSDGGDAAALQYGQLVRMTPKDAEMTTRQLQDLRDEEAEFAVPNDEHVSTRPDVHSVGDFQRSGEWLDKDRLGIADRVWDTMKIPCRKCQVFRHGPVTSHDPQYGPVRTMIGKAVATGVACPVNGIDFTDNTAAILDVPDKFMAEDAAEAHVALGDLNISLAYAGTAHPDERLSRRGYAQGEIFT